MLVKCKLNEYSFLSGEQPKPNINQFNSCCNFGNIQIEPLKPIPQLFQDLFGETHPFSSNFFRNIRNYNNALAMVSMGAQLSTPTGNGPFCYRIHGMVYHRIGPAQPSQNNQLNFGA